MLSQILTKDLNWTLTDINAFISITGNSRNFCSTIKICRPDILVAKIVHKHHVWTQQTQGLSALDKASTKRHKKQATTN